MGERFYEHPGKVTGHKHLRDREFDNFKTVVLRPFAVISKIFMIIIIAIIALKQNYPHEVPVVGTPYNLINRHGFSQSSNNKFEQNKMNIYLTKSLQNKIQ